MVGYYYLSIVFLVVCLTQNRQSVGSYCQHELLGRSAYAGIGNLAHLNGTCQTVFLHTKLNVSLCYHTVLVNCKMLFLGIVKHNRTSCCLGHDCCKYQRLYITAVQFRTKASAYCRCSQTNLLVRNVQGRSYVLVAVCRSCCRSDKVVGIIFIPANGNRRLYGKCILTTVNRGIYFYNNIRLFKAFFQITNLKVQVVFMGGNVSREFRIQLRSIRIHSLFNGKYRLQNLIFYINQLHCLQSNILCLCYNQSNRISNKAHILVHNMMMLRRCKSIGNIDVSVNILPCYNCRYSRICFCLFHINGKNFCIWMGTSQNFSVLHTRQLEVTSIFCFSCYDLRT